MPELHFNIKLDNGSIVAVYKDEVVKPRVKRAHEKMISEICLRDLLKDESLQLLKEESGAPYLSDPGWNISLSHSGPWYAFQISKELQVGVDIQVYKEKGLSKVSSYFVSDRELHLNLSEENLHLIWCAKEAVYKFFKGNLEDDRESAVVKEITSDCIELNYEGKLLKCGYRLMPEFALVFMLV